jgi:hypothetical protein
MPTEPEPEIEVCPECDGRATWDSCLCKGNGVIPKRPEQLRLFEKEKGDAPKTQNESLPVVVRNHRA